MPLDLSNLKSHYDWVRDRFSTPQKLLNAKYIKTFNELAYKCSTSLSGDLCYYDYASTKKHLSYIEGTPIFSCFKLVPDKHFIWDYSLDNVWQNYPVDPHIITKLFSKTLHKYSLPTKSILLDKPYILVPLQRHDDQLAFINSISTWAASNKQLVIFKVHPLSMSTRPMSELIKRYSHAFATFTIDADVELLVKNCSSIWTYNSGIGFLGLLYSKPVYYFLKDYDHTYPIAKFCKTIEEACIPYKIQEEELLTYLSWYYHNLTIDICSDSALQRMEDRCYKYFTLNYSPQELLSDYTIIK